ncbi:MAG: tryptophan synthase subunit alpha [Alphaproteobacteria bacterium]|nr:tryptophan synthase subunit alpha [Alphaproteobacteria bacterium]
MSRFDPERLERCFARLKQQNRAAFVTFVVAGDPNMDSCAKLLHALPDAGADIIELGMPFSDPMADGPTIQRASKRALNAGVTLGKTLQLAKTLRDKHPETPIILMGYYNPIYRFGNQAFLDRVKDAGVDGLIVVDLPPEEDRELAISALDQDIHFIRLITPTSTKARIEKILHRDSGFIYYVSITGITGTKDIKTGDIAKHLDIVRTQSDLPIVVGFGIKHPKQAAAIAKIADGVVVGSALVAALEEGMSTSDTEQGIKNALDTARTLADAMSKTT